MFLKLPKCSIKINCSSKNINIILTAGKRWQTHITSRLENDITFVCSVTYYVYILQQYIIYKIWALYFFAIVVI